MISEKEIEIEIEPTTEIKVYYKKRTLFIEIKNSVIGFMITGGILLLPYMIWKKNWWLNVVTIVMIFIVIGISSNVGKIIGKLDDRRIRDRIFKTCCIITKKTVSLIILGYILLLILIRFKIVSVGQVLDFVNTIKDVISM